jgi:hypothetical protein
MGTVGELPGRNGQFPCDRGGNSPTVPIAEATYGILTPRWAQPAARPETLRAYEVTAIPSFPRRRESRTGLPLPRG